jgi:hypothetical protein
MSTPKWLQDLGRTVGGVVTAVNPALGQVLAPALGIQTGTVQPAQAPVAVTPATSPAPGPGGFFGLLPKWVLPVGAVGGGLLLAVLAVKAVKK